MSIGYGFRWLRNVIASKMLSETNIETFFHAMSFGFPWQIIIVCIFRID